MNEKASGASLNFIYHIYFKPFKSFGKQKKLLWQVLQYTNNDILRC